MVKLWNPKGTRARLPNTSILDKSSTSDNRLCECGHNYGYHLAWGQQTYRCHFSAYGKACTCQDFKQNKEQK